MIEKMNTKNVLVSFLAIVTVLFLATTISAADYTVDQVKVDGIAVGTDDIVSVIAGETITVKVYFTSDVCDTDVTLEAELEGDKVDAEASTSPFDVETGYKYKKTLTLTVPYELKDSRSDFLTLELELDGKESKLVLDEIQLRVQRPSYNVAIKSISASQNVEAGETFPVDLVLKNIGYNDLDDLYVTASISALGVAKTSYFGDLVALECCEDDDCVGDVCPYSCCDEDDEDTVSGRLFLEVPEGTASGIYTLEVEVTNDDTTESKVLQIIVENDFESTVFKSGNSVWLVNPSDNVVGYRIIAESPASVSESIVFVPAGASKSVDVIANAEGEYSFDISVFTMNGELVETITFAGSDSTGSANDDSETNPVIILTVILAIIFIVLLIVLIVLIGKKPEKSGEFGESYY